MESLKNENMKNALNQFEPYVLPTFYGHGGKGGAMAQDNNNPTHGFNNKGICQAFYRNVFWVLAIMLGVTTVIAAIPNFFMFECGHGDIVGDPIRDTPVASIASIVIFAFVYIFLLRSKGGAFRRLHPTISICMLTLSIGFMTAAIPSRSAAFFAILQLTIAALCCVGCALFSMATSRNIVSPCGLMFIVILCYILSTFLGFIWPISIFIIFAAVGPLLFTMYLANAIQMIVDKGIHNISPGEYAFAALTLISDFPKMFWLTLRVPTLFKKEEENGGIR